MYNGNMGYIGGSGIGYPTPTPKPKDKKEITKKLDEEKIPYDKSQKEIEKQKKNILKSDIPVDKQVKLTSDLSATDEVSLDAVGQLAGKTKLKTNTINSNEVGTDFVDTNENPDHEPDVEHTGIKDKVDVKYMTHDSLPPEAKMGEAGDEEQVLEPTSLADYYSGGAYKPLDDVQSTDEVKAMAETGLNKLNSSEDAVPADEARWHLLYNQLEKTMTDKNMLSGDEAQDKAILEQATMALMTSNIYKEPLTKYFDRVDKVATQQGFANTLNAIKDDPKLTRAEKVSLVSALNKRSAILHPKELDKGFRNDMVGRFARINLHNDIVEISLGQDNIGTREEAEKALAQVTRIKDITTKGSEEQIKEVLREYGYSDADADITSSLAKLNSDLTTLIDDADLNVFRTAKDVKDTFAQKVIRPSAVSKTTNFKDVAGQFSLGMNNDASQYKLFLKGTATQASQNIFTTNPGFFDDPNNMLSDESLSKIKTVKPEEGYKAIGEITGIEYGQSYDSDYILDKTAIKLGKYSKTKSSIMTLVATTDDGETFDDVKRLYDLGESYSATSGANIDQQVNEMNKGDKQGFWSRTWQLTFGGSSQTMRDLNGDSLQDSEMKAKLERVHQDHPEIIGEMIDTQQKVAIGYISDYVNKMTDVDEQSKFAKLFGFQETENGWMYTGAVDVVKAVTLFNEEASDDAKLGLSKLNYNVMSVYLKDQGLKTNYLGNGDKMLGYQKPGTEPLFKNDKEANQRKASIVDNGAYGVMIDGKFETVEGNNENIAIYPFPDNSDMVFLADDNLGILSTEQGSILQYADANKQAQYIHDLENGVESDLVIAMEMADSPQTREARVQRMMEISNEYVPAEEEGIIETAKKTYKEIKQKNKNITETRLSAIYNKLKGDSSNKTIRQSNMKTVSDTKKIASIMNPLSDKATAGSMYPGDIMGRVSEHTNNGFTLAGDKAGNFSLSPNVNGLLKDVPTGILVPVGKDHSKEQDLESMRKNWQADGGKGVIYKGQPMKAPTAKELEDFIDLADNPNIPVSEINDRYTDLFIRSYVTGGGPNTSIQKQNPDIVMLSSVVATNLSKRTKQELNTSQLSSNVTDLSASDPDKVKSTDMLNVAVAEDNHNDRGNRARLYAQQANEIDAGKEPTNYKYDIDNIDPYDTVAVQRTYGEKKNAPLNVRNFNPGNLRPGAKWKGQIAIDGKKNFVVFANAKAGTRALMLNLKTNVNRSTTNTIDSLLLRYLGGSEGADGNDVAGYINFVVEKTGIPKGKKLTQKDIPALTRAIIEREGGPKAVKVYERSINELSGQYK